ncbi:MAG: acyl-CoA thioesterase [Bacteroidota bacterium]
MTEYVLPNDTNPLGNLMGGRLLHLMDICAAITAQRHAGTIAVTASVDTVEFRSPIRLGEIINMEGVLNRAFRTSMEVELNVWAENPRTGERRFCNKAFFTFVAMDETYQPIPVPKVIPETDEEKERYEAAAQRRELRLLLAGRIKLQDAPHLKDDLLEAIRA